MEAISDTLAMGGYGAFIWPAFAVAALVMVVLLVASRRALRAREAELAALRQERAGTPDEAVEGDEA